MKVAGIAIWASEGILVILIHLSSLIVNHLVIEILRFGVESLPRLVLLSIHDCISMLLSCPAERAHLLFKGTEDVDCRLS